MEAIRKSAIAGSWYPGKPSVLRRDIEKFFDLVPDLNPAGEVVGLIAPHAGYIYSGQVAAYAYKLVIGKKYDAVIVIGPSHRVAFHGVSIFSEGGYETPLGIVPVNQSLARAIEKFSSTVETIPSAHNHEHSLEIQLPFLQVALGDFSFVPLMMGDQDARTCFDLAEGLYQATEGRKILIVGSSDLSHFHDYSTASKMDSIVLEHMQNQDASGLLQSLEDERCEACGGGPMAVTMSVAEKLGALKPRVLKYANSGDVTGDRNSVVGYAAAAYFR
jgi:MEMO1 family protein